MDAGVLTVSCGNVTATLHKQLFRCPGIHSRCIEKDGEWITPKELCIIGDKARLKDWKTAIRHEKMSLRKMIEIGQLDFINHSSDCTGRCFARTGDRLAPPGYFGRLDISRLDSKGLPTMVSLASNPPLTVTRTATSSQGLLSLQPISRPIPTVCSKEVVHNLCVKEESSNQDMNDSRMTEGQAALIQLPSFYDNIDDGQAFWAGIIGLGMVDEVFKEIKSAFDHLRNDMIRYGCRKEDTKKANSLIEALGLQDKMKYRLAAHHTETERMNKKIALEVQALKARLRDQEIKQASLKRKSDCFEQLLDLTTAKHFHPSLTPESSDNSENANPSPETQHGESLHLKTCQLDKD